MDQSQQTDNATTEGRGGTPSAVPYLQSNVIHYTGLTVFNKEECVLQWSADGRIRAVTTTQPVKTIIDVVPQEITAAKIELTQLVLEINAQKYRFDFNAAQTTAGLLIGGSPILDAAGSGIVYHAAKNSAANDWISALQSVNVPISGSTDPNHLTKFTMKWIFIIFGGAFVLLILFFIIYMINE